jgi:hypothetical protein
VTPTPVSDLRRVEWVPATRRRLSCTPSIAVENGGVLREDQTEPVLQVADR